VKSWPISIRGQHSSSRNCGHALTGIPTKFCSQVQYADLLRILRVGPELDRANGFSDTSSCRFRQAPAPDDERLIEAPRGQFLSRLFGNAAGSRSYKLYVPADSDGKPCPLIVMLHPCMQSADDFARGTRMNALADRFGFLVAYPEQSVDANPSRCWNWFNRRDQQRDLGEPSIVAGITDEVMQAYAVDRTRVYVAGMSAGGAAAAVLAATYPAVYAALGVHSGIVCGLAYDVQSAIVAMNGGGPNGVPSDRLQRNDRPMPTIVFHGDRDSTVHPRNADRFAADVAPAVCTKRIETGQVEGGRSFTQTTCIDANGNDLFELWVVHGLGHAWSGGSASASNTDPLGPDASREMLRFFLSHRRSD
jgi:poly(hydroxyalkanoate) depolymerase family esterase